MAQEGDRPQGGGTQNAKPGGGGYACLTRSFPIRMGGTLAHALNELVLFLRSFALCRATVSRAGSPHAVQSETLEGTKYYAVSAVATGGAIEVHTAGRARLSLACDRLSCEPYVTSSFWCGLSLIGRS